MSNEPAVNGGDVLTCVARFIQRFVSLSEPQAFTIALWVAHTHALDAADTTPYLNISSAEKQCGKTLLLEVLSLLVAKPWLTGSASRAVLVRRIDAARPTLLLDERDAAFGGERESAEALRGLLNSGHSREGVASLCVGQGTNITFKDFQVFCPKAMAGIGKLPDTVADRSIPIRMKRRAPHETVERFRNRLFLGESAKIREQLAGWLDEPNLQRLRNAWPALPDSFSARQQDGCEPLLAIADLAGGDWGERARAALAEILTGEAAEDSSMGIRLLTDIRTVFQQQNLERIFTFDLLNALCDLEPQWLEFNYGKPLSAPALARLLKGFDIPPRKIRIEDRTASGYLRDWFSDAWVRYLPRKPEQVEQCSNDAGETRFLHPEHNAGVPGARDEESPINMRGVPPVPPRSTRGERERPCHIHGGDTSWWERTEGDGDWLCGRCHPKLEDYAKPERLPEVRVPTAHDLGFKAEGEPLSSLR